MATRWQRVRIPIPTDLTPFERELVASEIIDHIIERSQDGTGFNKDTGRERSFPGYSADYFKSGTVDLTLNDQMLKAMELLSSSSGSLLIGYRNGTEENAKADGNSRGTYGLPRPIPGKARPFLGLRKGVLNEIVRRVKG